MLRFEQLKFSLLLKNEWNGTAVTPIRVAHTLAPEPGSLMNKQKLQATTATVSLRDGARLTMIRDTTSPYRGVMSIFLRRSRR